ncbi:MULTISPECIES: PRD domain-containing protein [Atopobiaceae]|uniref:PRD domain-containing protein n=1 Tax=Atopobiaceae TaxID=1643824 RepID=UPI003512014B
MVGRFSRGVVSETTNRSLFRQAVDDFPDAYACVSKVDAWLRDEMGWRCNEEELLYLLMHVNGLISSTN